MSTVVVSQETVQPRLDIGSALKQGWHLFALDIGPLIIGTLIAGALSVVTLGILAGPLIAGLYGMIVRRVREGRRAEVGDVFAGLARFWSFFAAALFLVVVVGLASLTIVGGILLATIWLYVFPLMVDRELGFWAALSASKDLVVKTGFWEHLALVIIFVVIASVANGALALLAAPFLVAAVSAAYFVAAGEGAAAESA